MPDVIRLVPEERKCEICNENLNIRNTQKRDVITGSGVQELTTVTKKCSEHSDIIYRPQVKVTPPKSKYSFDVIVETGLLRFRDHKQIEEIHYIFKERGIAIPLKSIENLCRVFLVYCIAAHIESYPELRGLIQRRGGYVLQVDGSTTKGGSEVLILKDGWSDICLLSAKITSESSAQVKIHLETIRENLGNPVCAIRDMGKGIKLALIEVFPDIYIIICHFHFLKSVGKRLFSKYQSFKRRVERTGILKKLRKLRRRFGKRKPSQDRDQALEFLDYLLSFKEDGNGMAFPFSLPILDFYRRCEKIRPKIRRAILDRGMANICSPALSQVENALDLLRPPPAVVGKISKEYQMLKQRRLWFERIRKALRYRNGPIPLNTIGCLSDKDLEIGRKMLDALMDKMKDYIDNGDSTGDRGIKRVLKGILDLVNDSKENLFAPNVVINVNGKLKVKQLPRTNNSVEHDFRRLRRHARRIRGDSDVERSVQRDGVGQAIVQNLNIGKYVRCVYGSMNNISKRFGYVSPDSVKIAKELMDL